MHYFKITLAYSIIKPLLLGLLILFSNVTNGQDKEVKDSIIWKVDDLEEITLISGRSATPSPLSVSRIRVRDQYLSAVERIDQYLNFIPGVEMQTGALNTNRIHIRGIGSRSPFATSKIRAFINDIPLTDGIGETSIEDLNLGFLNQVEMWKGPFSSTYGSPLGGIIRFTTPRLSKYNSVHAEMTIGDFGFYRLENSAIVKTGKNSQLLLNNELIKSDGYRSNNELEKHNFNGLWSKYGKNSSISVLFSLIDLNAQIPSSINITDFNTSPFIAAPNWQSVDGYEDNGKLRLGVNYTHSFGNQSFISNTIYGYLYDAYELRPFNILDDQSKALSVRTRYFMPFGKFNLEIGQETFIEQYEYDIYKIVDGDQGNLDNRVTNNRRIINVYSEYYYDLSKDLRFGGGFNLNLTSFRLDNLLTGIRTSSDYGSLLSPRFYLAYNANSLITLRLDAAHGFANPSIDESIGLDGLFNHDIKQEEGWCYEFSSSFHPSSRINLKAILFFMEVNDIIVNRQNAEGQSFGINGGATRHRGVEILSDLQLIQRGKFQWTIRGNLSLGSYRFRGFIDGKEDFSGNQLTGVAPGKWSVKSLFRIGNTAFSLLHRYVDAIPVNDGNTVFNESFHISNMLVQQEINAGPIGIRLTAEIENLFNNRYASMVAVNASSFGGNAPRYYYPGLPVNGKMTLNVFYKW